MARYKDYSYDQHKLLPIAFREQILSGTFEYTLNYLIDKEVDLSVFEARYRNDDPPLGIERGWHIALQDSRSRWYAGNDRICLKP